MRCQAGSQLRRYDVPRAYTPGGRSIGNSGMTTHQWFAS